MGVGVAATAVLVKAAFWIPLALCTMVAFRANPTDLTATLSGISAHTVAFAYLAVALFVAHFRSGPVLPVVLWMLAFGVMIEVGQTFVDGRTGELFDVFVDGVGIAVGCAIYRAWLWRRPHPSTP
ncbi:MAG: VanZ family protein [Gammaproteobacteria bacterium]|nr:VanZ family protein [Gammaproteobacteria bacterium]